MKRNGPCLFALVLLISGCGGGTAEQAPSSPDPGSSPPASTPPSSTPPSSPPPSAVNHPPVIQQLPPEQRAFVGRTFSYDLSLGGTVAADADNDPLTYTARLEFCTGASGIQLAQGLALSGARMSGTPVRTGYCDLQVDVTDNRAGTTPVSYPIRVRIANNSAPVVSRPNQPLILNGAASVDYDTTQGGTTFVEPDGDPMTYQVVLRGDVQGLGVSGTRVVGTLPAVGAVDVVVTASDAYGGSASESFLVARAAPVVSDPRLPLPPFIYQDEKLPLPYVFRLSSTSAIPLWDTQPADNRTSDKGAALGRVLFYDKRLSLTNSVSCASCHEQDRGFASPERFDVGITGIPMKRNSMALANARYNIQGAWFWDLRAEGTHSLNSLQDVVLHPLKAHDELGMTPELLLPKLAGTSYYPTLFSEAFGSPEITIDRVGRALGQFVQALVSYRSRADQALSPMDNSTPNPALVFTPEEMAGLAIFKTKCNICHKANAHANEWQANNGLDEVPSDPGTTVPAFQRDGAHGVFRAPSLRNIAVSAPYMHDGRFATLREVIEHYNSGVKDSPDLDAVLRDSGGAVRRLNLTEADKDALEAFLRTLTDQPFLDDPKFSDPFK